MDGTESRFSAREVTVLFVAKALVMPVAHASGVKHKCRADRLPLYNATIRNTWSYTPPKFASHVAKASNQIFIFFLYFKGFKIRST